MSNKLITQENRAQLISVLQDSLYPGAKTESVEMLISYCEARNLDPMLKPAHIVPMSVKNTLTNNYEYRDIIMPGIGLYRIQADRAESYDGMSEPEFGPMITQEFTDKNGVINEFTFPEYCKLTVNKLIGDRVVSFTAKEYWIENYATDSGKSSAPNAMWKKRPRGQISKCAEAQALRKGWPEIGSQATADEMEGKTFTFPDESIIQVQEKVIEQLPPYPQDQFDSKIDGFRASIAKGRTTASLIAKIQSKYTLTQDQKTTINSLKQKAA